MDGRVLEFNHLYCQMLGYSPDEVRKLTYQELTPERWHVFEEGIVRDQILLRGYSDVYEKEYRRKDGSVIAVELRAMLVRDAAGQPDTMWALVRDITDRKASEARLAEREAQLALFVENAPAAIAMFDPEMRYLAVSHRFLRDYGLPKDLNVIGRSHYEMFPQIPQRWRDVHARVLAGEELSEDEDASHEAMAARIGYAGR